MSAFFSVGRTSSSDLSLFPGVSAVLNAQPAELVELARRNHFLPTQLSVDQLTAVVAHIQRERVRDIGLLLIHLRCLSQLQRWTDVIAVSSHFLTRHPCRTCVRQLRAQAYFESQQWTDFIADCNEVIDENRPDLMLLTQRCCAYFKIAACDSMLKDVRKIVELSAWSSSSGVNHMENDLDPANPQACLRALCLLLNYFPHDLELLRSRARGLFHCQKCEALLQHCFRWQRAIAPQMDRELTQLKMHACVHLKNWPVIIRVTTEILHHSPGDAEMLDFRAKALAAQGDLLLSLKDHFARHDLLTRN
ncbi:MAG: hypothetical protein LLG04_11935 [Parachlamydia sp.]|nr:hypothetical protein [Parachlamydia sp.]